MHKIHSLESASLFCQSSLSLSSPRGTHSQPCFALHVPISTSRWTEFLCKSYPWKHKRIAKTYRPALTSSSIGILTIAYNFIISRANVYGTAAITGTVFSILSSLVYIVLILWTRRRMSQGSKKNSGKNLWSEQTYYSNFIQNMYPTAARLPPHENGLTEDDRVNQQMALLLTKNNPQPSPDINSTFHINLPEDRELQDRQARSQELGGSYTSPSAAPLAAARERSRNRAASTPDSLGEEQAWQRWAERGRLPARPQTSTSSGGHARTVSREERRREIELGFA